MGRAAHLTCLGTGTDSGNSSPVVKPVVDTKIPDASLQVPRLDSPRSTSPNPPTNENTSKTTHRRTNSVQLEGDDYLVSLQNYAAHGEIKTNAESPRNLLRNISFSPRIIFHDTWPSGEYDRRGEIATCNRPLLWPKSAQIVQLSCSRYSCFCHSAWSICTGKIV